MKSTHEEREKETLGGGRGMGVEYKGIGARSADWVNRRYMEVQEEGEE